MKRVAIITTVVAAVVLVLGVIEWLTNFQWAQGDQDPLFGNPRILLNDGKTAVIAGGFLLIGAIVMWIVARRRDEGDQHHP